MCEHDAGCPHKVNSEECTNCAYVRNTQRYRSIAKKAFKVLILIASLIGYIALTFTLYAIGFFEHING